MPRTLMAAMVTLSDGQEGIVSVRRQQDDFWPYRVFLETDREYESSGNHVGAHNAVDACKTFYRFVHQFDFGQSAARKGGIQVQP